MKRTTNYLAALLVIPTLFILPFVVKGDHNTETDVSGDTSAGENQPGWIFNRDTNTDTPFEFNEDEASIGDGSLYVLPIGADASDKFIGENFINAPIADVESISYDFMIGSGGEATDEEHFYMNVYANFGESADDKFYDCRYNVVPTTGSVDSFTTVTFDPTMSYNVTTRGGASASPYTCPAIPADMDDLSEGSNIRAFAINVGDTSTNDVGLDGYLDNVVVVEEGHTMVYDFEPADTSLAAEDFGVVDYDTGSTGQLSGYTAGFGLTNAMLSDVESAVVRLYGADDQLLQTNTAIMSEFGDLPGSQFSSPFDVSGDFDYEEDGYWVNERESEYGQTEAAVKVVATVTLENGDILIAENTNLTGDPTTIMFPTPQSKDDCKNGGWMDLEDGDGNPFRNQGQCVSWFNHNS